MTDAPNQTPPGWYPNQHGQTQWWDGQAWGPIAPPQYPQVVMAQRHPQEKSVGAAYCFLVFLGSTGAHRMYLNQGGRAAIMLLLLLFSVPLMLSSSEMAPFGLLGITALWIMQLVDLFILARDVRKYNAALYQA